MLVAQSCATLCDPRDSSQPGSSARGFLQARILEWVAIPFSRDLLYSGIGPGFPALQADSLPSEPSKRLVKLTYLVSHLILEMSNLG